MPELWPHQSRALVLAREAVSAGHRRILIVSPTGSGKGTLGAEILRLTTGKGLFIVHRREIILDQAERLRIVGVRAGVVLPGHNASPYASVQVASTKTLLNRMGGLPPAQVIVIDECHHYASNEWSKLIDAYPDAVIVGLTATPQRGDGKALSQFQHMIVAAQYSELLAAGLIVPARVYQPAEHQGRNLALDPVAAYKQYADKSKGFCFVSSIELGEDVAARFRAVGVPAQTITGKTPKPIRDRALADLRAGRLLMLINVNCLTEGVDCPDAQTCILASANNYAVTYLQRVGRVLRSAPGKTHALVLDLVGASISHGLPTADREYSLDGKAIGLSNLPPLTVCASCGLTQLSGRTTCEGCGFIFIRKERRRPYIDSQELRAVYDHENTPETAKLDYFLKLIDLISVDGYDRIAGRYRDLFGADPPLEWRAAIPTEIKKHAFEIWKKQAEGKGWKRGYAFARYIESFGSTP